VHTLLYRFLHFWVTGQELDPFSVVVVTGFRRRSRFTAVCSRLLCVLDRFVLSVSSVVAGVGEDYS
jgi:hypothetical protein